jgi:hypothetical protein
MSSEYILYTVSSPAEGREAEYHAWYDDVHLPEFCALPGVVSGRRFQVTGPKAGAKPLYAAVYEMSKDPAEVLAAMFEGVKAGTIHLSDAIDPASSSTSYLKALQP